MYLSFSMDLFLLTPPIPMKRPPCSTEECSGIAKLRACGRKPWRHTREASGASGNFEKLLLRSKPRDPFAISMLGSLGYL